MPRSLMGCCCHPEVWTAKQSLKRKRAAMQKKTGHSNCVWKGRQGPWFVAEGRSQLYADIASCTSDRLEELLGQLPEAHRTSVLSAMEALRSRLLEHYKEKFDFWDRLPWKALGIFHGCCKGSVRLSKQVAQECLDEMAVIEASGATMAAARVTRSIFGEGGLVRAELTEFAQSDRPLEDYGNVFIALQEFSLVTLVERRVESIHAQIKWLGKTMCNASSPYICAKLREGPHLELLRSDPGFMSFCLGHWSDRTVLSSLLAQRQFEDSAMTKTRLGKIKTVYQCSLEMQFENTVEAAELQAHHERSQLRLKAPDLPIEWAAATSFWKYKLVASAIYSMPKMLFDACVQESRVDIGAHANPVQSTLVAVTLGVSQSGGQLLQVEDDHVFFQVTNSAPEKRVVVHANYMQPSKTRVNILHCPVVSKGQGPVVELGCGEQGQASLEVLVLAASMSEAVRKVVRWKVTSRRATVKPRAKTLAICPGDDYMLPVDVSSGGSSSALVAAEVQRASREDDVAAEQVALEQIEVRQGVRARLGRLAPSVPFSELSSVRIESG